MITNTIQQAEVPDSDIVVTVVEEVLRHTEPRHVCYAAYVMGTDPRNGEWFRKGFSRGPSEKTARAVANGFWTKWARIAHAHREA
jgi:hypothetical protein